MSKISPDSDEVERKPVSFIFNGRKLVTDGVIDRWHEAEHEYVTLLADDERIYFLRRDEDNHWEVKRVYSYY